MEQWKAIAGAEGIYEVSNEGRVRRLACTATRGNGSATYEQYYPARGLAGTLDSKGYRQVKLPLAGLGNVLVHRLVAKAFLPTPSEAVSAECLAAGLKYVLVNHIDCNPDNNRVENLEWCSPKYNCDWAVSQGRHTTVTGVGARDAILTEVDVDEILVLLREGRLSQQSIADSYGVKQITISNIWTGRSWAWYTGIPRKERSWRNRRGALALKDCH